MTRKDYCQLQFGVILGCLIYLSLARTVLSSSLERNSQNVSGYEGEVFSDFQIRDVTVFHGEEEKGKHW